LQLQLIKLVVYNAYTLSTPVHVSKACTTHFNSVDNIMKWHDTVPDTHREYVSLESSNSLRTAVYIGTQRGASNVMLNWLFISNPNVVIRGMQLHTTLVSRNF